ncbi:MAG: O-antigen translocase [Mesorhizobium sp.]
MSLAEVDPIETSGDPVTKPTNQPAGATDLDAPVHGERSYLQIFKSSATIAGSSLVQLVFSIARNKSAALWLGPDGVGLMGLYNSIIDLAQGLAGSGLVGSGVRQIAEANGTGDSKLIARTATALRWLALALGVCGALLLVLFATPIASLTFGNSTHTVGVALVAAAVFLRLFASGQTALLQGLRKIGDLARVNIFAAMLGACSFVALIWAFGKDGIVPALILDGGILAALAWYHARRIDVAKSDFTAHEISSEARQMLRLGLVFMANGLFTLGATYAVRIIVTHEAGIGAAGLYQAAWALASLYAGFILQAMGVDFYPRLTAAAKDNDECNRLVNEQTHVSILLAGPGLLATLTLAPLVVHLFYSSEFTGAVSILRWFCLGMMLRIVAWPMGFIVLAKNEQRIFFWTELIAALIQVGLAFVLVQQYGPVGAGAAFFGLYLWHSALIGYLAHRISGFRWSAENIRVGGSYILMAIVVCVAFVELDNWTAMGLGLALTALCSLHSLHALLTLVPHERLPRAIARFVRK